MQGEHTVRREKDTEITLITENRTIGINHSDV